MRLRGTFYVDPQAACSIQLALFHYYDDKFLGSTSFSKRSLLPTVVLLAQGVETSSYSRSFKYLLRSLSCQHHRRGQWSALFCRRYVATRRCPCKVEIGSTRSWGRPSDPRILLGRRLTDFLDGSVGGRQHLLRSICQGQPQIWPWHSTLLALSYPFHALVLTQLIYNSDTSTLL